MLNSTKTFTDWNEFYTSSDSAEIKPVDANFREVFNACSSDSSPVDRLTKMCGFPAAAILVLVREEGETKPGLEVIHHIQRDSPPGAPPSQSDKWYGILGLDKNAPTVEIPLAVIKGSNEAQVPSPVISKLLAIQTHECFADIVADTSETNPSTFLLTPVVPITPILISAIQMNPDKTDLISTFRYLADRIDEIVAENVTDLEDEAELTAMQKICSIPLQFIWGATRDTPVVSIFARSIFPQAVDELVVARFDRVRVGVFGAERDPANENALRLNGLEILARNQGTLNATLAAHGSPLTDNKSSSHYGRLHIAVKQLILNASAKPRGPDEQHPTAPAMPNPELMALFEAPKTQAKATLSYALTQLRRSTMMVDQNLASNVHSGTLLAQITGTPQRFSVFYCGAIDTLGETSSSAVEENWDILLESQNLTKNDIANHHTSTIKVAKDHLHLLVQLKNFLTVIDFLFTYKSYLYVATHTWVEAIEQNPSAFSFLCSERKVVTTILQIIETRTQLFLKSCAAEANLSNVAFHHINYSDIIAKFIQGEIPQVMIAPIVSTTFNDSSKKSATKRSSPTKSESGDEDAIHQSPSKQKKAKTAATSTKNPEHIPDTWKMSYKSNSNLFHKNIETIPKMSGVSICLKWHTLGKCTYGEKCLRKATHKPITGETKRAFEGWIQGCQANQANL